MPSLPAVRCALAAILLAVIPLDALAQTAWPQLSATQRNALAPLEQLWPQLNAQQQQQWLALAQRFASMPPAEQATLHSRMNEWARMTPTEREQARMGFDATRSLPDTEKRARWQQYQTLPAQERARLANDPGAR